MKDNDTKLSLYDDICKYVNALSSETNDAIHYLSLLTNIQNQKEEFQDVFNNSKTFWVLTLRSIKFHIYLSLCRIYDNEESCMSLPTLLNLMRDNIQCLDLKYFQEYNKNNPQIENLSRQRMIPSIEELDEDLLYMSEVDPEIRTGSLVRF